MREKIHYLDIMQIMGLASHKSGYPSLKLYYTYTPTEVYAKAIAYYYGDPEEGIAVEPVYPVKTWQDTFLQDEQLTSFMDEFMWKVSSVKLFRMSDALYQEIGDMPIVDVNPNFPPFTNNEQVEGEAGIFQRFISRMTMWLINRGKWYYERLKLADEAGNTGYLSPVKSNSKTGFRRNDTPDGVSKLENYYDDDPWATTTNASNSENTTDFDTPAGRLREALEVYPNILEDFSKEFEKEFGIYEY